MQRKFSEVQRAEYTTLRLNILLVELRSLATIWLYYRDVGKLPRENG